MENINTLTVYTEILGQPDTEHFNFIRGERDRLRINRQLGFIWDYTPTLWDKFISIDEYFEYVAQKLQINPGYRRVISTRAANIRNILGR